MNAPRASRSLTLFLPSFVVLLDLALGLSLDGVLLLQFKYAILSDPLAALRDWSNNDALPCSWNGVVCAGGFPDSSYSRVTGLHLLNSELVGSIPPELGLIEHLRQVELSGNFLNGTLPPSIFNAPELCVLSLAGNKISGELPDIAPGRGNALRVLNLSDNVLVGVIPSGIALLPDLTVVSLANNYLSGELPARGFGGVQHLNLGSNLIYGSLPPDLAGQSLRYLDLSGNQITGAIPPEWSFRLPANATINLSFNNLTGEIPQGGVFASQTIAAYAGNSELCGKPLNNLCTISSSLSAPPNSTTSTVSVPQAFAAMPLSLAGKAPDAGGRVIAIAVGNASGIALLVAVVFFVYKVMKKKRVQQQQQRQQIRGIGAIGGKEQQSEPPKTAGCLDMLPCCLRGKDDHEEDESEETCSASSDAESQEKAVVEEASGRTPEQKATLVTVDGEADMELEMLLKASAYVLGASGSTIVYKVVLANGTALAVRRIGVCSTIDRLKDFDAQVRGIAKLRHPNLLHLRGFFWSTDEKLLIHDLATNGSLANITFTKKLGSSPFHMSWDSRLRIARGVARGLAYLHKKKAVHGNLKPSNILLDSDMEPKIADFGLDRLMSRDVGGYWPGTSGRLFGSKRSVPSRSSVPDQSPRSAMSSPCGSSSASALTAAAAALAVYQAPEHLKNLKPSAKCDVYSFGVVLLELLTGRVLSEVELGEWSTGFVAEERSRVVRMADPAVREEVEGREETLLSCFNLGFACCAVAPQRRPAMKEAVQVLDKLPSPSSSSS